MKRLEGFVTNLAEWSCSPVQKEIIERGDDKEWAASFYGFYLTRGHYSNISSATLHDHYTGRVAWFVHRTKRGPGHKWNCTSGGAEADILNEVLGKAKEAGFVIKEMICDKDSSTNATFCRHFPEGMVTHCSNHSAKNSDNPFQGFSDGVLNFFNHYCLASTCCYLEKVQMNIYK